MITETEMLENFQKSFKGIVNTTPTLVNKKDALLRVALLQEELDEMKEAIENDDIVELLDAIIDIRFLNTGDIVVFGFQNVADKAFTEVYLSNMSKLDENSEPIINGENGVWDETRPKGKLLKSRNYKAPNLRQFLSDETN